MTVSVPQHNSGSIHYQWTKQGRFATAVCTVTWNGPLPGKHLRETLHSREMERLSPRWKRAGSQQGRAETRDLAPRFSLQTVELFGRDLANLTKFYSDGFFSKQRIIRRKHCVSIISPLLAEIFMQLRNKPTKAWFLWQHIPQRGMSMHPFDTLIDTWEMLFGKFVQ